MRTLVMLLVCISSIVLILNFHLVKTSDGFHAVTKNAMTMDHTYIDLTHWSLDDYRENLALTMHLAEKGLLADELLARLLSNENDAIQEKIESLRRVLKK